jgi:phytoene dehydrogenase-like protein
MAAWLEKYRKPVKTCFYYHPVTGRIEVGFPEEFEIPEPYKSQGYQKLIARDAHTLGIISGKMRDQDARDMEQSEAERELVEAPIRQQLRAHLHYLFDHARDAFQRDAIRRLLAKLDLLEKRRRDALYNRLSYMHCEAAEDKK